MRTVTDALDAPVLVVVDHAGGVLTTPSAELLTLARRLAGAAGAVAVALTGPDLEALGRYGAARIVVPDLQGLAPEVSAVAAEAVLAAVEEVRPAAVLVGSTFAGKELAARLAVALGSGAVVDATGVRVEGGTLAVDKTVFAGTWSTTSAVTRGVPVVAVKAAVVDAEPEPSTPPVDPVAVDFSAVARAVELVSRTERPRSGRPPLSGARTVVVGGRGTGGDFTLVEELADELGAAVGATRVAVDEGWVDHSAQVGQTGTTISPRLYIGAGVSGAIHHTAGIQAAETVVAVCDDPDAPIFEIADFGVVGDLNDVLPQAIAELRKRRG